MTALAVSGVAAQETSPTPAVTPTLVFDAPSVDVGETYEFGTIEHEFSFVNRGERDVHIEEVQSGHNDAVIHYPDVVGPGAKAAIRVVQPLEAARLGVRNFRFVVHSDATDLPTQVLELHAFVQSAYDEEHPLIDFGDVDRSRGATQEFVVSTREAEELTFERVVSAPEYVQVRVATPAVTTSRQTLPLDFTILPGAPLGWRSGVVHLQTSLEHQRDYVVGFQASVFGEVVPEESPITWGAVRQGESVERMVRLTSRRGTGFRVVRLSDSGHLAASAVEPCHPPSANCQMLRLTLDTTHRGGFRGEVHVFLEGDDEPLPIRYDGLVASPDARIEDLGVMKEDIKIDGRGTAGSGSGREPRP